MEVITRVVAEDLEERLFSAARESTAEFEAVLRQCESSAGLDTRLSLLGDGETRVVGSRTVVESVADGQAALLELHEDGLAVANGLHLERLAIVLRALRT